MGHEEDAGGVFCEKSTDGEKMIDKLNSKCNSLSGFHMVDDFQSTKRDYSEEIRYKRFVPEKGGSGVVCLKVQPTGKCYTDGYLSVSSIGGGTQLTGANTGLRETTTTDDSASDDDAAADDDDAVPDASDDDDDADATPRTCADTAADGSNTAHDCESHANSLDTSPESITCAGDTCTDTECCTEPPPCNTDGTWFYSTDDELDMPGQGRTAHPGNPTACKERCAGIDGCTHFNFFSNGGCHMSDNKGKEEVPSRNGTVHSGPVECQIVESFSNQSNSALELSLLLPLLLFILIIMCFKK